MKKHILTYPLKVLAALALLLACVQSTCRSEVLERYVKTSDNGGSPAHGGLSWADAKDNLQDAINELHIAMQAANVSQGHIYVAAGKYNPTESTEAQNSNILNTSFLIYDGITIYGGYPANPVDGVDDPDPAGRALQADVQRDINGNEVVNPWNFVNKTILSGNHSSLETSFTFQPSYGQYNTRFPSSSYHVVWFGTKGAIDSETAPGHRQGLSSPAGIDGCIIEEGYASSRDLNGHNHMGFGGGAYMVPNSFLRNCIVRRCQAAQRGGGVYLDGGGTIEHCYIHTCQVTGVAIAQGYGGAVCVDYDGAVKYSYIAQSTARIGGGLAICHTPNEYPFTSASPYDPYAVACIIANNTSAAEGGGVYLDEGGTLNHCTVVKNNCIGPDITYYGRRHGRSGGVYVRNCGMLYNSVMWGNKCAANSDIQFAAIQQTGAATTGIDVYHCALYNQDITDWSYINKKEEVFSLTEYNRPHRAGPGNCCWFEVNREILGEDSEGSLARDFKAGVDYNETTMAPNEAQVVTTWRPRHASDLSKKGVQVSQTVHVNSEWIRHAHTAVDILGNEFELSSTLGAIVHDAEQVTHTLVLPQGKEGRAIASPTDADRIPTVFVDAQRDNKSLSEEDFYIAFGNSWERSTMLISDAVAYFEEHRIKSGVDKNKYRFGDDVYPAVQILVKEGTYTTAGRGNYEGDDIRTASIRPKSNMRLYGGYSTALTGTSTDGRNPGEYLTIVSCNIVGSYANNSAHAFGLINVQNVVIDGIRMFYGNTDGMETTAIVLKGTGLIVSNTTIAQDERIDMTGNVVRNSVVANTQSYDGAAFYVNALMPKTGGETVRAELRVENTVIRNCTSLQDEEMEDAGELPGIVVANGNARIELDHCTLSNNAGYPLKTRRVSGYEGEIVITNSALFANSTVKKDDRSQITEFAATLGTSGRISGHHNMFDAGASTRSTIAASATNQYILSVVSSNKNYPTFKNPSINVGHSESVDRPLYGGVVSYEPLNRNPLVNAADDATMTLRDQTDVNYFDYGGAADIGAIENTSLPKNGAVLYVTPDGAGKRDGSSWGNAIAGNTIYALNGAAAAGTDQLDDANGTTRIINTDPAIGTGADHGVLTTDNRYQGGFALYSNVRESIYLTSHSHYRYTEKKTYTGGGPWDKVEIVRDNEDNPVDVTDQLIKDGVRVTDERAANPTYPYGELSGASRTFWRANPYEGTADSYLGKLAEFMAAVGENHWINNSRNENYVSGLQYAVEKASAYNTLPAASSERMEGVDSITVWVSNGKYTDYKGFVMRDKTTVMGSFPAVMQDGTLRTPGLNERQALMSAVVNIPKAKQAQNYDPVDYESILQISDINPKKSNTEINPAAILFSDRDYTKNIETHTTLVEDLSFDINHQYTWDGTEEDWTDDKILYPDFTNNGANVTGSVTTNKTVDGVQYRTFGTPTAEKDCWHLSNPSKANYVANIETGVNNVNNVTLTVYDPETMSQLTGSDASYTCNRLFMGNGSLTGLNLWQTIPNLPKGNYRLSIDMAGGYRNKFSAPEATNIFFHIIGADGSELITPKMLKPHPNNSDSQDIVRKRTFRYVIDFTQPTEGPLTLKVVVEDGLRNTTANNSTYGTATGGDPDPIPKTYADSYGGNNPNRREFWVSNLHLTKKGVYNLVETTENRTENIPSTRSEVSTESELTVGGELKTLRKRVLTMPDITCPTYGGGNIGDPVTKGGPFGDDLSHRYRLTGPSKALRKAPKSSELEEDPNYVEYSDVYWNGFTIRHGFLRDEAMAHGGGAGVNIYEGAHLQNCIVTDNFVGSRNNKGGGVFCDGATSTVEGCFLLNNTSTRGTNAEQAQLFAGGFFLYEGTCYNTLIANNYAYGFGGGLGLCVGNFYNNTIAYNTSGHGTPNGGIRIATGAESAILMANTIIYGNNGAAITMTKSATYSPFIHCYIQSASDITDATITNAINAPASEGDGNYGVDNEFLNNTAPSLSNTPFSADVAGGSYTGGSQTGNDFRLRSSFVGCINRGSVDFEADMIEGFKLKKPTYSEADIKTKSDTKAAYEAAANAVLPPSDVAFADRIQDCSIDIGAYEYNGAVDIEPDTVTFAGQKLAIYYVTENGFELGNASANSPDNAACAMKLQKVLDAAGRYKYDQQTYPANHPTTSGFDVIVALGGNMKDSEGNMGTFAYSPERSTKAGTNVEDNVLDYSLIIPHGVQLWGGFNPGTGTTPGFYEVDGETGKAVMLRDILRYPTFISGDVVSSTGATGQAHHVISFTNDLFDTDENIVDDGGQLAALTSEKDRAVIDGLFVVNGYANGSPASDGSVTADMNGAAAIVTSFAHVRNCIITANRASGYGGGLYLQPHALVSGTVVKDNVAQRGGGLYVEQPAGDIVNENTFAFILTSTVVNNTATERGGGLVFESNLRANSSVFWHNSANDKNNVSGNHVQSMGESSSVSTTNYPMVYCGVEVTRWEGVNNLLVSANETEGVRWDHQDYYERYHEAASDASLYFPIEMSSVLARAGMTYQNYEDYRLRFPTLELTDIAGMSRMEQTVAETVSYDDDNDGTSETAYIRKKKANSLIEMGARVVNATYEISIDPNHIMRRLYVVHTEDLESEVARRLQDNGYIDNPAGLTDDEQNRVKMYSQMGSCFANPFHRLGDALQYVIDVRNSPETVTIDGVETSLREYYRNQRFEIFLTNGTFYPYRNAYGRQAASRSNTFVIPEMVTLIGGVKSTKPYGQAGYGETGTEGEVITIPVKDKTDIDIKLTYTQTVRTDREQSDLNMNNVVEPWELNSQSILSGNVVSGTESKNVYHVVTCYPDADKVGWLPMMYDDGGTETSDRTAESRESRARRTIFIDGVTVTNGMANDISDEDKDVVYQQQTYFRGGGILVDGNWDKVDELSDYIPDVLGVANRDIPLVVTNSMFQDNMAGNGGAIYSNGSLIVTGCHFVQNSSRGPNTALDQRFIPWTAGGAIATNFDCTVVNTIFANNEARRGTLPITISGDVGVQMADIRQGFGGVISSSETSTVHALNCDFVRNKAVAFPAIYNFLDNKHKKEDTYYDKSTKSYRHYEHNDYHHWAVNCIFWGNEANEDVSDGGQVNTYLGHASNDPSRHALSYLFTVDEGKTPRRRDDIANFGIDDRKEEVCFFSAYEAEHGLASELMVVADDDHKNDHKKLAISSWNDFERGTFMDDATYPSTWQQDAKRYTHNQYLDANNDAINGPNFIQPSTQAGIGGYMQNADWLVSRLNRIIDNGWSYIPQHVTISKETIDDATVDVYNTIFEHEGETEVKTTEEMPTGETDEHGDPVYTTVTTVTYDVGDEMDNTTLRGSGIYNFYSLQVDALYGPMGMTDLAALGEHPYMKYDRYGESTGMSNTMRRISTYPKLGEQEVFIDIGVYEYQYVQLFIPGNAYDVIWVRPDNPSDGADADGTTWAKATNNVQQAIDMLMSSHNDHDKVLKVRAGDYSPVYLTHGKLSFYIEHSDNTTSILYPTGMTVADYLGVNGITIRGGYPNDEAVMIPDDNSDGTGSYDGELVRDPELYPARFVMPASTGYENRPEVKENLFVIQNMERQEANQNFIQANELKKVGTTVPVTFEGITFANPYGIHRTSESDDLYGAAILYTQQNKSDKEGGGLLEPPATKNAYRELVTDGRPKLLIKNCVFLDNATQTDEYSPAPAVHILGGGGDAVIANSLFHSNGGNPVEAVNTKVVNCTFALNSGQLTLTNNDETAATGSELHNSLIWRDQLRDGVPYHFAYTILGNNNAITDFTPTSEEESRHNVTLNLKNSDILHGPNFTRPLENTAGAAWLRDMHPRPSDIVIGRGDSVVYRAKVPYYQDASTVENRSMKVNGITKTSSIQTVTRTYKASPTVLEWRSNERELAWMPRFTGNGLERGPYEVVAAIQRVLYVNPTNFNARDCDGTTWEKAFGAGHLQDAVDAAGVYSATNSLRRAFVFVKGDGLTLSPSLQVRDGVTVYGGVASMRDSVLNGAYISAEHKYTYKEKEIFNYVNRMRSDRSGVASTNVATASLLAGVMADGDNSVTSGFVLDGFHITNGLDKLAETPVRLYDDKTLLRNCLVYANSMDDAHKASAPVIDITGGLLYNTLVYGNDAATVVNVGSDAAGGVLNCTVVADHAGQTAVRSATADKVVNTITYNEAAKTVSGSGTFQYSNTKAGMFAPYLRNGANAYDYPFGDHRPYWYQLHEQSAAINGGTNSWSSYFADYADLWEGLTGVGEGEGYEITGHSIHTAQKFIDFAQDRDVLGNPRLLRATVDQGAFETWRIEDDAAVEVHDQTDAAASPVSNYGGHLYPHLGSVVYLGSNAALVVRPDNFTTVDKALVPAYVLLREGASLYGQGNHLRLPYVATERSFAADQQYALFSLPYDWSRTQVVSTSYASAGDALSQTDRSAAITATQRYDGSRRAQWDYAFHTADSPCWTDADATTANEGYLLTMDAVELPADRTLRFTAWGVDEDGVATDIYAEDGTAKTVALQQYDQMPIDGKAHFTANEHMGWNLKGMPWLVSGYKTYAINGDGLYDGTSEVYQMNVPHLFYNIDKTGSYVAATQSWANGATLSPGDAYLTQTAIIGDEELLTFRQPYYYGSPAAPARPFVAMAPVADTAGDAPSDLLEVRPAEGDQATLAYHDGSDGAKWLAFDE